MLAIISDNWPTITVIQPTYIVQQLLTHQGCPDKEARIPKGLQVKIQSPYIPNNQTWYWEYTGSSTCMKMPENLTYTHYLQTSRYSDDHGKIIAFYGIDNTIQFTFTIPTDRYWDCGPLYGPDPPHNFGCAGDMLRY